MTGLINRLRRYTDKNGNPLVIGLFACGDAHTCTNPAYGRGQSLALLQATMLADALAAHDDLASANRAYEAASAARVEPWYHFSRFTDQMRAASGDLMARSGLSEGGGGFDLLGLMGRASDDVEFIRTVLRVMNLLELPDALLAQLPRLHAGLATR